MAKRAVVTGGAGFIGSHLAGALAENGYDVLIFDDLSTGKLANIEPLLEDKKALFVQGTVTDLAALRELCRGVDHVFHLAAIASVPRSIDDPIACHNVNATGTLNVLLAARDSGVKKVIFASSAAVYGDAPGLPKREDMALKPLSPYAVAKITGEYYCQVFLDAYGLPTVSLRYFNVYGPRQDPASDYAAVIPKFIEAGLKGKPPVIFGDGKQTRDFAFVRDVAAANIMVAQSDAVGVFNISCGERTTISRLAELIMELTGSRMVPVHEEARAGDIRHSLADISRAKDFGLKTEYDLKAGLTETVEWFRR